MIRRPPRSTLFPYTTLFRSEDGRFARARFFQRLADGAADLTGNAEIEQDPGEFLGIGGTLAADPRQDRVLRDRAECFADAAQIFVFEDREDECGALTPKSIAPRRGERARGHRIVRAIDDGAMVPTLKTRGPLHR